MIVDKNSVYQSLVKELYVSVLKKNIGPIAYIEYMRHITKNFQHNSPTKEFIFNFVELNYEL